MLTIDDAVFEERLKAALIRAAELDYGNKPSDEELERTVHPSPRLERRMKALLRNPRRYVRSRRKPIYLKVLQTAASVAVALAVLLATAMAVSPTVRAAVVGFVRSWFSDRVIYETQPTVIEGEFTFGYIPVGFELVDTIRTDHYIRYTYSNSDSTPITITVSNGKHELDNEHSDYVQTTIGDCITDVYKSNDPLYPNIIVIYMDANKAIVDIISQVDLDELTKIAENIT